MTRETSERQRLLDAVAAIVVPGALLALLAGGAGALQQADLLERIRRTGDGAVRLEYGVRDGVLLCRRGGIRLADRGGAAGEAGYEDGACQPGPVVAYLEVRGGEVRDLDLEHAWRGRVERSGARDLGRVEAREAARALLALARSPEMARRGAERALAGAVVADSATVWPELLALGRDGEVERRVRKAAVFWAGQVAAEAATAGLRQIVEMEEGDLEVRKTAVFALSQLPEEDGVPVLMEVARSGGHPALRKNAFFWLAQADDPRVLAFFEEVLARGGRR